MKIYSLSTPRLSFRKRIAQYNGSGSENFCWQNVKSLLTWQNCFILHSSFVRVPLLSYGHRNLPQPNTIIRSLVRPLIGPSVHLSKTFTPGVDKNKRKLFRKLCSHRLVFPNQKIRKIGIVFLTVKYVFIFLLHEPSLCIIFSLILKRFINKKECSIYKKYKVFILFFLGNTHLMGVAGTYITLYPLRYKLST